jgi:2-dehydropantoate 2-reductase
LEGQKAMQPIHNVAILGAGAMGAYFAACFQDAPGFNTVLIAQGERRRRLQAEGLRVNGKTYQFPVVDGTQDGQSVDFIVVAVKHHQLAAALDSLGHLAGEQTIFLSVMNGLESEEIIAARYGWEQVLYAISVGIDAVREDGQVRYSKPGIHYFGEARNDTLSAKVLRVQEAFDRAGIHGETPVDMLRRLWWKYMVNVGVNQASAVMRAPYGVFHQDGDAQALMEALMREVVALARASQVDLSEQDIRDWYPVLRQLSPQGKTSMLQDVEAGRKTEVEIFGGRAVTLGEQLGVPTPVNASVTHIIRVLERSAGV